MPLSHADLTALVVKQLTKEEAGQGVAYAVDSLLPTGTQIELPKIRMVVPWEAFLVFVDREPTANWSHSCRYILISREKGETKSVEAQLPPFGQGPFQWRVVYQAPGVPDSLLVAPKL